MACLGGQSTRKGWIDNTTYNLLRASETVMGFEGVLAALSLDGVLGGGAQLERMGYHHKMI